MNNLVFKKVESYFFKKYPTGSIYYENKKKNVVNVAFTEEGKVYSYKINNHVDLINRLKLDIKMIYQYDYDYYIKEIEKFEIEIKNGFWIDDFFGNGEKNNYTESEIDNMKKNIECYKNKIENVVII